MTKVALLHLVNEYRQRRNRLPENPATPRTVGVAKKVDFGLFFCNEKDF